MTKDEEAVREIINEAHVKIHELMAKQASGWWLMEENRTIKEVAYMLQMSSNKLYNSNTGRNKAA